MVFLNFRSDRDRHPNSPAPDGQEESIAGPIAPFGRRNPNPAAHAFRPGAGEHHLRARVLLLVKTGPARTVRSGRASFFSPRRTLPPSVQRLALTDSAFGLAWQLWRTIPALATLDGATPPYRARIDRFLETTRRFLRLAAANGVLAEIGRAFDGFKTYVLGVRRLALLGRGAEMGSWRAARLRDVMGVLEWMITILERAIGE